jgi:glycosyltransferase involved in cell wall biosynthesis
MGIAEDAPLILSVAALEERKGIQSVLASLPHVCRELPCVRYLVVGEGAFRPALESMVDDLGLRQIVHFVGTRDDVAPLYQAADVFCLLSEGEANPLVLYEAMATGVPLVTSANDPFPDVLDESVALLARDLSPVAVAAGLIKLLRDNGLREAMSRRAITLARERHSFAGVARLVAHLAENSACQATLRHPMEGT